jgi:hypothetical protein
MLIALMPAASRKRTCSLSSDGVMEAAIPYVPPPLIRHQTG